MIKFSENVGNGNKQLNDNQISYLDNDVKPFLFSVVYSFLVGAFQVATVIYVFAFNPLIYDLGKEFIDGWSSSAMQ